MSRVTVKTCCNVSLAVEHIGEVVFQETRWLRRLDFSGIKAIKLPGGGTPLNLG